MLWCSLMVSGTYTKQLHSGSGRVRPIFSLIENNYVKPCNFSATCSGFSYFHGFTNKLAVVFHIFTVSQIFLHILVSFDQNVSNQTHRYDLKLIIVKNSDFFNFRFIGRVTLICHSSSPNHAFPVINRSNLNPGPTVYVHIFIFFFLWTKTRSRCLKYIFYLFCLDRLIV